ncbi:hypothetical protein F5Y04DRAFT_81806 [Hypomontagnella monticulosa]|nr:hypothetical protein F5Y04DRAFT_81806 [Hypomontagnella monticulosa]
MARSFNLAVALLWLLSISGVKGEDDVNRFTYPTASLSFNYLDTVEVAYVGNISKPLLYTFCRNGNGNVRQQRIDHPNGPNATAPIKLNFTMDVEIANCWFNIRLDPSNIIGANSENFRYNSTEANQKTFSLSSATSSTSSTSSNSPGPTAGLTQSGVTTDSTIASTDQATPSPSASVAASPGLSTGAQAGIGVGVGLVGIAIGAAAVALVFRRRRMRGGEGSGQNAVSNSSHYPPTTGASNMNELFQDDASKPGSVSVPYAPSSVDLDGQKFRGAPTASRYELDGAPPLREMP